MSMVRCINFFCQEVPKRTVVGSQSEVNSEWLSRSLICTLDHVRDLDSLFSRLSRLIPSLIDMRCLGVMKYILTFSSLSVLNQVLIDHDDFLRQTFKDFKIWKSFDLCETRLIWIEVISIPPHAWHCDNFEKISKIWGDFVCTDKTTEIGSYMNSAHCMIATKLMKTIDEEITLFVGNEGFNLYIKEFREVINIDLKNSTSPFSSPEPDRDSVGSGKTNFENPVVGEVAVVANSLLSHESSVSKKLFEPSGNEDGGFPSVVGALKSSSPALVEAVIAKVGTVVSPSSLPLQSGVLVSVPIDLPPDKSHPLDLALAKAIPLEVNLSFKSCDPPIPKQSKKKKSFATDSSNSDWRVDDEASDDHEEAIRSFELGKRLGLGAKNEAEAIKCLCKLRRSNRLALKASSDGKPPNCLECDRCPKQKKKKKQVKKNGWKRSRKVQDWQ